MCRSEPLGAKMRTTHLTGAVLTSQCHMHDRIVTMVRRRPATFPSHAGRKGPLGCH